MADKSHESHEDDLRLDKWLWAARFFKTRGLAQEAIKGGKIEVNGDRPKPARHVQLGDMLRIRRGQFESVVRVTGLSRQRGPATATVASAPQYAGRPNKRDRRHIVRFTRKREG
jgi:ribosome-associated heat shock protein Hsp15